MQAGTQAGTQAGKSLGRVAYQRLHDAIETGSLKPGDRISVNGLAESLGISRTPVREAIAWLETDGLIVHEPYLGRVVARLDRSMIAELYAMRLVLEPTAAAMAAQNASDAEIEVLQEMLAIEREMLADPLRRERQNRRLHQAIHRSAHNRYLLTLLQALQTPMILLGPATATAPERLQSAFAEHERLVAAIARHDAQAARDVMREHLEGGQRARVKHMLRADLE